MKKEEDFNRFIQTYDIEIKSDKFAVIMVKTEDYREMFQDDSNVDNEEYAVYIVTLAMLNIIGELANTNGAGMAASSDDAIVLIFNVAEVSPFHLCEIIQTTVSKYLHVETTLAVSDTHKGFAEIPACYREAFEAMEHRVTLGSGGIIRFCDMTEAGGIYEFSLEQQMKLENYVKTGDANNAALLIKSVLKNNDITGLNPKLCRLLILDMISAVIRSINAAEKIYAASESVWTSLISVDELMSVDTAEEMETIVLKTLMVVCEYINENRHTNIKNVQLKDSIIAYVNRSYHDVNLNVSMVANDLGKNFAYISRYFKEQMGEGLLDYINRVRIEHTKEFLKSGEDITMTEIAERVGFINATTLIRVFKKYEGITPGQFKKV
jgi:AraC-like DNA-binding protein